MNNIIFSDDQEFGKVIGNILSFPTIKIRRNDGVEIFCKIVKAGEIPISKGPNERTMPKSIGHIEYYIIAELFINDFSTNDIGISNTLIGAITKSSDTFKKNGVIIDGMERFMSYTDYNGIIKEIWIRIDLNIINNLYIDPPTPSNQGVKFPIKINTPPSPKSNFNYNRSYRNKKRDKRHR